MIKLIKVVNNNGRYTFDDLMVNPENVSVVEESYLMKEVLLENSTAFPEGLNSQTRFSILMLDNRTYTVVGGPEAINEKLGGNRKKLLLG